MNDIKPTLLRLSGSTVDGLRTAAKLQRRSMASLADEILRRELVINSDHDVKRLEKIANAAGKVT